VIDFSCTHIGIKDSNEVGLLALIKVLELSSSTNDFIGVKFIF
jgi:hypothetical protein